VLQQQPHDRLRGVVTSLFHNQHRSSDWDFP
jgi:hypothetical protein